MRPASLFRRGILTLLASAVFVPACSDNPTPGKPTQVFDAPKVACPASVALLSPTGLATSVVYQTPTATGGAPPVVITCTPPSGSTFPVGVTAVSCTATDQLQRTDACAFVVSVTAPPRLTVTRFLAYGDSITWGEDGTILATLGLNRANENYPRVQLAFPNTYPGALQGLLSARYTAQSPAVANAGKPGEQATDPTAVARFTGEVTSGRYDAVLLMEGANDLSGSDLSRLAGTLGAMQVMVQTAKNRGLTVFLATIPPEDVSGSRGANAPSVTSYNAGIRSLAASARVPLVDVYQAFAGDLTLLGADGLHPNAAGYQRIADTFFAAIKQNLEATSAVLSGPGPLRPSSSRPGRR